MDWLWIVAAVLALTGLALFPWLGRSAKKTEPKRGRTKSTSMAEKEISPATPGSTEETVSNRKIDPRDRDEMLDGVRNLARDNPKKVASVVRHWMKED